MSDTNSSSKKGIDIHKALEILSLRSSHDESVDHQNHSHDCQHHTPEGGEEMGQTIDLVQEEVDSISKSLEERRKSLREDHAKRGEEIRSKLETMSVSELLNKVMEAQEDRVATYREYDTWVRNLSFSICWSNPSALTWDDIRGLDDVLLSGNITKYPTMCAKGNFHNLRNTILEYSLKATSYISVSLATASFSFLSDTIKTIQYILQSRHNRRDLSKLIESLQRHEQEKLNVTAALHLERIRMGNENGVAHLLQDGIATLRQRNVACVEAINDVLDEIRLEIAEQNEL